MRHGATGPRLCSQCAAERGVSFHVRRVDQQGPLVLIDGVPAGRLIDSATDAARSYYGKRGGQALRGSKTRR